MHLRFDLHSLVRMITTTLVFSVLSCSAFAFGQDVDVPTQSPELASELEKSRAQLESEGFARWEWLKSDCRDCEIRILATSDQLQSRKAQEFLRALADNKVELQQLYGVDGQEYNLLAHMAVGILGRESLYFSSELYAVKEAVPDIVHLIKVVRSLLKEGDAKVDINSRGPTQIKIVPKTIADAYGITPAHLRHPEHAALATMGFLIEALDELKRRIPLNHLDHINPSNYADYLPYMYFGSRKKLLSGSATPEKNLYVQYMKRCMEQVEIYERPK